MFCGLVLLVQKDYDYMSYWRTPLRIYNGRYEIN